MLKVVFYAALVFAAGQSFAGCGSSSTDKNCVNTHIKDSKVILPGGHYADPGGHAKKSAETQCCYEKATSPGTYEKKYNPGSSSSSGSKKSGGSASPQ